MGEQTIKERVQDLCRDVGISARALEKLLGFGQGYISRLDKTVPNIGKVRILADYFGVTTKYLLTGEEEETGEQPQYYINEETARVAQSLYENKALSLLFDEARDAKPEDFLLTYNVLKALKDKERRGE